MDEKQLQFLYSEYAKNKGFKDYSEFKGLMSSEGSRKLFFDDANAELGFKDYNEFNDLLGLKKKAGGEVSSLTKSPSISQEYIKEGQELADKGFIKTEKLDPSQLVSQYKSPDISLTQKPKKDYYSTKLEKGLVFDKEGQLYAPSSEALTKSIAPAEDLNLKKSTQKDLVEQSRIAEEKPIQAEEQGLLLNLVSSLDKGFAKNFISSPIKGLGTILQGTTKKVLGGSGEGFVSDALIKYGDYLNNAIDELTPQDEEFKNTLWDQAAQAVGQIGSLVLTGGLTGAAGKGAALVSQAPKGAALTAVKTLGSQLSSPTAVSAGLSMGQAEFDRAIQAGATEDQAFEAFYKNAAVGSVLETIPVMQFFKRFNNTTAGSVANYIKTKGVAGLTGGIEEMTTEVMQQLYANKTAKDIYNINQDILDGVGSSGGIGFGIGFLLNAMGANAKILRKQGKIQEADVLENQVKQYEDNLENPKVTSGNKVSAKDIVTQGPEIGTQKAVQNLDRDLANNVITPEQYQQGIVFAEKAAQVADKIPETVTGESRVKSVELLVERNDIKQANENLIQQKQTTDEAYHAGIDEEIKTNEERIKKLDSEVYNIAKKPSKEFGDKKYIVDGEEVSKEAFEALQGKPIGTKEIITAEVKPIEEFSPEDDIEKRRKADLKNLNKTVLYNGSDKKFVELKPSGPVQFEDIENKNEIFLSIKQSDGSVKVGKAKRGSNGLWEWNIAPIGNKGLNDDELLQSLYNSKIKKAEVVAERNYDAELAAIEVKEEVKPTEVKTELAATEGAFPISELNKIPKGELSRTEEAQNKLKDDILKNGIKEPLTLVYYVKDNALRLKEGHHRLDAANKLGLQNVPIKVQVEWDNSIKDDKDIQGQELYQPPVPLDIESYKKRNYQPTNIKLSELGFKEKSSQEVKPAEVKQAPKKTYQEALKEKQAAEKKQTRQTAGEKAAVTRKTIEESNKIEASDARSAALKYLTGGKLSWDAINEVAGRVKRATLNTGAREFKSEEARSRDYVAKKGEGQSLDEAADSIWNNLSEEMQGKMDTQDVKNALMMAVSEYNSKSEMAQALIDGYKEESLEDLESKYYERFGDNAEIEIDKELNQVAKNQLDIEQELINANYESEQQFQDDYWNTKEATNNFTEKAPSAKAQKAETAKGLAEAYKDLTINQKRQIINSKFDELLKELKIEKICPT
jgi:hypothetical protein